MLHHRLLIQLLHLPTKQIPQFRTDHPFLRPTGGRGHSVVAGRCSGRRLRWGGWGRFALPHAWGWETLLAVNDLDSPLKAAEEILSAEEGERKVDGVG